MITEQELAALPEKTKKNPEVVALYRRHDFMEAYAMHTDLRVSQYGYKGAIGAVGDWERHGVMQAHFLGRQGVCMDSTFLDVGCGTGRLARKMIPLLLPGKYFGVDISQGAIDAAREMLADEGIRGAYYLSTEWPDVTIEFAWAFSVTIHLPPLDMLRMMESVAKRMHASSIFFFSYVPEKRSERTGLKQFRHTREDYVACAKAAGLWVEDVPEWEGEQKIFRAMLA